MGMILFYCPVFLVFLCSDGVDVCGWVIVCVGGGDVCCGCLRICGNGVSSGLYGMTVGNVRVLFVGGLSASSCD